MHTITAYRHIVLREDGVPILAGTSLKVVELVMERQAWSLSPEQLQEHHPELSLGQVFSALSYYADHREALDLDIQSRGERVEEIRREIGTSPLAEKLRRRRSSS